MEGQQVRRAVPLEKIGFRHAPQGLADIDQPDLPSAGPKRADGRLVAAAMTAEHRKRIRVASRMQQLGILED